MSEREKEFDDFYRELLHAQDYGGEFLKDYSGPHCQDSY